MTDELGQPQRPVVTVVAPYDRDLTFGGSIRATALAEGLAKVGRQVRWRTVSGHAKPLRTKLAGLIRGVPALVTYHQGVTPVTLTGPVLVAHSYLASTVRGNHTVVLDWHNLEWQHLRALAGNRRGVPRFYLILQSHLMRRVESRLLQRRYRHIFCNETEMEWARTVAPTGDFTLIGHQLPVALREVVDDVYRDRQHRYGHSEIKFSPELLYVGKLTYPANEISLTNFVRDFWPDIRRHFPELYLRIVGETTARLRANLAGVPGLTVAGPVSDLAPYLKRSVAAVLPFAAAGGSSVRVLTFAACGLPVLVVGQGARGYPDMVFPAVTTVSDLLERLRHLNSDREHAVEVSTAARAYYDASILSLEQWRSLSNSL
jgi:hypothetical protein